MYKLNRSNGTFFTSIPNNVILGPNVPSGTPAPINLIGRDKVSYGGAQNENFLWLTENFCNRNPPTSPIRGQLWYDTTNDLGTGGGGELKIAPADNISPQEWVTVATVGKMNTEPSNSLDGRFIIYKNNTLKVRINKEWRSIVTEVAKGQQLNVLLPIRYTDDLIGATNTTIKIAGSSNVLLARFNEGGYLDGDGKIAGTTDGTLRYGSCYQYEASILGRDARNPEICKFFKIRGTISVKTAKQQGTEADPRKIVPFTSEAYTVEVVYGHKDTEKWDVSVAADQTVLDYKVLSPSQILNSDAYGLNFFANLNQTSGTTPTQWSINLVMTGIQMSQSDAYINL